MATLEELVIQLSADTKDLQAELKASVSATQSATEQMAKSVEEFSKSGGKSTSFFQNALSTMAGFVGGDLLLGAFRSVKDSVLNLAETMISDGVKGAIAQQDAMNQLNNALARSGNYSKDASDALDSFASTLQRTTKFEDDVILSTAALIETMTQLDQNGLKHATQASVDLAAAFNIDLETAARAVSKGIEGSTDSLKKFGISVQEGATKAETTANVFAALQKVSGSAAGQANTYSGQLAILTNTFGELQESIGNTIVKNAAVVGVMKAVNDQINKLTGTVGDNDKALKLFIAGSLTLGIAVTQMFFEALQGLYVTVKALALLIPAAGIAIGGALIALGAVMTGEFKDAVDIFNMSVTKAGDILGSAFDDTPFTPIVDGLEEMGVAAGAGFMQIKAGSDVASPAVKNVTKSVKELTAAQEAQIAAGLKLRDQLNEQTTNIESQYQDQLDLLNTQLEEKTISEDAYWESRKEAQNERYAEELEQLDAANQGKNKSDDKYIVAKRQLDANYDKDSQKMTSERKKFEEKTDKQKLDDLKSTFSTISTLSSSHNKSLAAIGKAAAITTATIDGVVAVQKALAAAPPPFNFALAALVGVATAANVAKISGVQLASGIDNVPGVGRGDKFPALLEGGERVVPRETNKDLSTFLENAQGGAQGGPVVIELRMKGDLGDMIEATLIERENLNISLRGAA